MNRHLDNIVTLQHKARNRYIIPQLRVTMIFKTFEDKNQELSIPLFK
jgi:hypothetical protein